MALKLPAPPEPGKEDARQMVNWRDILYRLFELTGTVTATPGLIAAGGSGSVNIPVTGCRADIAQTVLVGAPSTINAGLVWCGFISGNDTVTVRIYNPTVSGITPASGQWTARVFP